MASWGLNQVLPRPSSQENHVCPREPSEQAEHPTDCSRPHATAGHVLLRKHSSDYQQEGVIPDKVCFISPCKTLNASRGPHVCKKQC